jgi:hypothetical protein
MFYGGTSDEGDRPESIGYAWSNDGFNMFYGGTSDEGDRPESIGYAWSNDGFNWHHFGNEPAKCQAVFALRGAGMGGLYPAASKRITSVFTGCYTHTFPGKNFDFRFGICN